MKFQIQDTKQGDGIPVQIETGEKAASCTKGRLGFLLGAAILLALLTAAILGSVYLGFHLHTVAAPTHEKTVTADFQIDNHPVLKETIILTDREHVFVAPNTTLVKDFQTGLATYKFDNYPGCYLTSFDLTDMEADEFRNSSSEITVHVESETERHFKLTDISVRKSVLGPMASVMCAGRDLFMIQEQAGQQIESTRFARAAVSDASDDAAVGGICIRICWGRICICVTIEF